MSHNQTRLLLSDEEEHTEWFRFRNINKWIHKFWKPAIDGMYVGKYRNGKLSTGIFYDKNRNISFKVVNGRMIKQ